MDTLIRLAWSCAPGLIVGVVLAVWGARQKKREAEQKTEEEGRVKSELLRISLVLATAKLSYAVAMAIKRGKPNGEIEDGIAQYNKSLERFREFEREQLVRNVDI